MGARAEKAPPDAEASTPNPAEPAVPITPWAVKLAFMVVAGVAVFLGGAVCVYVSICKRTWSLHMH